MFGNLVIALALAGCNPPLDANEGPSIKFEYPTVWFPVNQGDPLIGAVRLVDRDGEGPMTLTLTSSIDGDLGTVEGLANYDVATFVIDNPVPGENEWTATATDEHGTENVRSLTFLVNGAPSPAGLEITPAIPYTNDHLTGDIVIESEDPEGTLVFYAWRWENLTDGQNFDGLEFPASIDSSFTEKGQEWRFTVTAYEAVSVDGQLGILPDGANTDSSIDVTIANSPPDAPGGLSIAPVAPLPVDDLVCTFAVSASDADGDPVSPVYQWEEFQNGNWTVVGNSDTLSASDTTGGLRYRCTVSATDGDATGPGNTVEVDVSPSRSNVNTATAHLTGSSADRFLGEAATGLDIDISSGSDLLIGLPYAEDFFPNGGWVSIFSGTPASGSSELVGTSSLGGLADNELGAPLVAVSDATGDQVSDLLVGALATSGATDPSVLLVPGDSLALTHIDMDEPGWGFTTILHADSQDAAGFGAALSAGDVDNNGISEVFISQVASGKKNQVFMFSDQDLRPNTSITSTEATTITSNALNDEFGAVMASGRDVTGDGIEDLVVTNPKQGNGRAVFIFDSTQLVSGNLKANSASIQITTDGSYAVGASLALGDFNGDGIADVAVGAPNYGDGGAVFVYFGGALAASMDLSDADITILESESGAEFGAQVQTLADRGTDGYDELLVAAPSATSDLGEAASGVISLFLGERLAASTNTLASSDADLALYGEDANSRITLSGPLNDLDDDGVSDWLVVSPSHSSTQSNEGKVYLFLSDR